MENNAIILESDPQAAHALKAQIEASSRIQCIIAIDFKEMQSLLERNPQIKYIFCVYGVSSNEEQIGEQTVAEYVHRHHPFIKMCSIGSIKKEQIPFVKERFCYSPKATATSLPAQVITREVDLGASAFDKN